MATPVLVDVRGLSCPQPVLLFHQQLQAGSRDMDVLVDTTASRENVTRAALSRGLRVQEKTEADGVWRLEIRQ